MTWGKTLYYSGCGSPRSSKVPPHHHHPHTLTSLSAWIFLVDPLYELRAVMWKAETLSLGRTHFLDCNGCVGKCTRLVTGDRVSGLPWSLAHSLWPWASSSVSLGIRSLTLGLTHRKCSHIPCLFGSYPPKFPKPETWEASLTACNFFQPNSSQALNPANFSSLILLVPSIPAPRHFSPYHSWTVVENSFQLFFCPDLFH